MKKEEAEEAPALSPLPLTFDSRKRSDSTKATYQAS